MPVVLQIFWHLQRPKKGSKQGLKNGVLFKPPSFEALQAEGISLAGRQAGGLGLLEDDSFAENLLVHSWC